MKKHCAAKILIVTIIPINLVTNLLLALFCIPFQNHVFTKMVVWEQKIVLIFFCFKRIVLYFKAMSNYIDFGE